MNQATIYVVAFTTAYNSIFFPFVMSLFTDLMKGKTGKKKEKKKTRKETEREKRRRRRKRRGRNFVMEEKKKSEKEIDCNSWVS